MTNQHLPQYYNESPPIATAYPVAPTPTTSTSRQQAPLFTRNTHRVKVAFLRDRRGPCDWILNLLWILVAGWHLFLAWFVVGIVLCCTIIMIPCGIQVFKIGWFLLFPFGQSIQATSHEHGGHCGGCNCCMNFLWMCTVGWILSLQAIITGILLCCTIVGIPFGWQCFKLAALCFWPFGLEVSPLEVVETTTTMTTYSRLP